MSDQKTPDTKHTLSPVQMWLLALLRMAIGWHFLYEGVSKLMTPGWSSAGYLDVSRWILGDLFGWIAANPGVLAAVDFLNIWGQILVGLGLIFGLFTRVAAIGGAALLALYYVGNPPLVGLGLNMPSEGSYLVVDKNLVEFFALVVLAFVPTGSFVGLDRLRVLWGDKPWRIPEMGRREALRVFASVPVAGAFGLAWWRKRRWDSYEEKNLVDAMTSASTKAYQVGTLSELKGDMPMASISNIPFSRVILGGNLLSGWAHSRDLIYVSRLVKAYHHKDKIFATLLLAERCGINTLLTNPILCSIIEEYWKRGIGKMQFISDCSGLDYDEHGAHETPKEVFHGRIQKAIDHGAVSCYIQGETADWYIQNGKVDAIAEALELIRSQKILTGIGAHSLDTIKACVEAGFDPNFWMKTFHHHEYWSARHPEWHDNMYCDNPEETMAYMGTLEQPWIAFKTMAAGAIHPKEAFRYAFEGGADFVCAGMYDFQMVEDVNLALDVLSADDLKRERPWRA